jgi:hypothetical protein
VKYKFDNGTLMNVVNAELAVICADAKVLDALPFRPGTSDAPAELLDRAGL